MPGLPGFESWNYFGVFAPTYALRSERDLGAGDFRELETLVDWIGARGGHTVGTLPLLPTFLNDPFDLGRLIDQCAAASEELTAKNNNQLVVDRSPDLGIIEGDETKLRQAILNLLSNAAKFTRNGKITVAARQDDAWITIDVRDSGVGISPENLVHLFQNFGEAEGSTSSIPTSSPT